MTHTSCLRIVTGALLFGGSMFVGGCTQQVGEPDDESVARSRHAVVGVDTFLYFRSNASGWGVDGNTILRPTLDPNVFEATYPVTESWMVNSGDNGIFTETNQNGGWGTTQAFFGSSVNPVIVPAAATLSGVNGFSVRYPMLSTYQVSVNVNASPRSFSFQEASPARRWEPNPTDVSAITTIAVAPQNRNQMVVGYTNGDIFLTFNGLSALPSWLKIDTFAASGQTFDLPGIPVTSMVIGPGDGKTIYAAFAGTQQGRKLWKTGTGGASWIELSGVPVLPIANVSLNPIQPQRVYVVADGGAIATSDDGGTTWSTAPTPDPLQPPISGSGRISTIAPNDTNNPPNQVWVGASTGEIFVSFNAAGAQTWTRVNAATMPARLVTRLTINPRNLQPPEVWATFQGLLHDSIWLTSNGGQIWLNRHNPQLPTTSIPVTSLALYGASVNPVDDNVVYVDDSFGAASRTENRGLSWLRRSF
jgi:hypothetical protein